MQIDKSLDGEVLTLGLSGRLDTNTAPELEAELQKAGIKARKIVFDMAALDYLSSAGLRVLIATQKRLMAGGGGVVVANPNEVVRGVLDMTGCSDIFEIH